MSLPEFHESPTQDTPQPGENGGFRGRHCLYLLIAFVVVLALSELELFIPELEICMINLKFAIRSLFELLLSAPQPLVETFWRTVEPLPRHTNLPQCKSFGDFVDSNLGGTGLYGNGRCVSSACGTVRLSNGSAVFLLPMNNISGVWDLPVSCQFLANPGSNANDNVTSKCHNFCKHALGHSAHWPVFPWCSLTFGSIYDVCGRTQTAQTYVLLRDLPWTPYAIGMMYAIVGVLCSARILLRTRNSINLVNGSDSSGPNLRFIAVGVVADPPLDVACVATFLGAGHPFFAFLTFIAFTCVGDPLQRTGYRALIDSFEQGFPALSLWEHWAKEGTCEARLNGMLPLFVLMSSNPSALKVQTALLYCISVFMSLCMAMPLAAQGRMLKRFVTVGAIEISDRESVGRALNAFAYGRWSDTAVVLSLSAVAYWGYFLRLNYLTTLAFVLVVVSIFTDHRQVGLVLSWRVGILSVCVSLGTTFHAVLTLFDVRTPWPIMFAVVGSCGHDWLACIIGSMQLICLVITGFATIVSPILLSLSIHEFKKLGANLRGLSIFERDFLTCCDEYPLPLDNIECYTVVPLDNAPARTTEHSNASHPSAGFRSLHSDLASLPEGQNSDDKLSIAPEETEQAFELQLPILTSPSSLKVLEARDSSRRGSGSDDER